MKKIIYSALFLLLTACGGDSDQKAQAVGSNDSPQVQIPANAIVSDYTCNEHREFTRGSSAETREYTNVGVAYDWKDGEYFVNYEVDNDGKLDSWLRSRHLRIDEQHYRVEGESITWRNVAGQWNKDDFTFSRVWQWDGTDTRHVIVNQVNGVDKPYYWQLTHTKLSDRQYRVVQHHSNPSVQNRGNISYTKIEVTCTYTDR